jgi:hypothetical protein
MNAMATIQNCDVRMRAQILARVAAKFEFAGRASAFSVMDILFVAEEKKRSKSDARVAGRSIATHRS